MDNFRVVDNLCTAYAQPVDNFGPGEGDCLRLQL